MSDVVDWVTLHERDEVELLLGLLGCEAAANQFAGTWKDDAKTLANIFSTTNLVIAAYGDRRLLAAADRGGVDPIDLLDREINTLYLVAPPADQRRLRVVFTVMVRQVLDEIYRTVTASGRPMSPPVLFVLDEAANVAPIPDLATVASTGRSYGLQLLTIFQDLAQLKTRYGAEAPTIVNNHRAKLVLTGNADVESLDLASRLVGDADRVEVTVSRDGSGRRTRSEANRPRRLAPPELIRQQRTGDGILLYGNLPPAKVRLRPWFADRRLRALGRLALPATTRTPRSDCPDHADELTVPTYAPFDGPCPR